MSPKIHRPTNRSQKSASAIVPSTALQGKGKSVTVSDLLLYSAVEANPVPPSRGKRKISFDKTYCLVSPDLPQQTQVKPAGNVDTSVNHSSMFPFIISLFIFIRKSDVVIID